MIIRSDGYPERERERELFLNSKIKLMRDKYIDKEDKKEEKYIKYEDVWCKLISLHNHHCKKTALPNPYETTKNKAPQRIHVVE